MFRGCSFEVHDDRSFQDAQDAESKKAESNEPWHSLEVHDRRSNKTPEMPRLKAPKQ